MSIFKWFLNLFWLEKQGTSGDIVLGYGLHEIKIDLEQPCNVFIAIKDCDGTSVCCGDVNKIGIQVVETGFILYADIKTNSCLVEWKCK